MPLTDGDCLVDRASGSCAVGSWSEYCQGLCNKSLNTWHKLIPLATRNEKLIIKRMELGVN